LASDHLEFELRQTPDEVRGLTRRVIAERRWFVDELGPTFITVRTGDGDGVWRAAPITIRMQFDRRQAGTVVSMDGKWPGNIGPWARQRIAKTLSAFRATVEFEAGHAGRPPD
jgi:hypothetical protein